MDKPVISICIPVFNGQAFLRQCLDSCLNQTYKNYEIVICDDGSSDGGPAIIDEYAQKNGMLRFYKNESNLGLVGNWNRCIELARGEWIKFVFQDDYISADCLSRFMSLSAPSTFVMVSERNFILPENPTNDYLHYYTSVVRTLKNTSDQREGFFEPRLVARIAVQNMCMNFIGEPSLTFFRKCVIEKIGPFNASLKQICDLEFFLRAATVYGLLYVPEKLCAFSIHANSTTSSNVENKYFEMHYIEPLLFSWFLLFGAQFAAFRSHLNYFQKFRLRLYFRVKCYKAYAANLGENRDHWLFRAEQKQFPEIPGNKSGGLVVKLVAGFTK